MNTETDDLVKIHVDLPNHWWFKGESMWAKPLGNNHYEIQNVPFCAYGLNCGDIVLATSDAPGSKPEIRSVIRRSGQKTLRAFFMDGYKDKTSQQPYIDEIERMDSWVERANAAIICINVNTTGSYESVCSYLKDLENSKILAFETCEERVAGSFDDFPEDEESI